MSKHLTIDRHNELISDPEYRAWQAANAATLAQATFIAARNAELTEWDALLFDSIENGVMRTHSAVITTTPARAEWLQD